MNRRILIQVATPIALTGLLLLGACVIGAWQIDRLQTNMSRALTENAASLRAAEEIEVNLRRLRFHCIMYLITPHTETSARDELLAKIKADESRIKDWLKQARESDKQHVQGGMVDDIELAFQQYMNQFNVLKDQTPAQNPALGNFHELMEAHPVQYVVDACDILVNANRKQMDKAQEDAAAMSRQARMILLLLGLGGPLGGIVVGYGVARGLSRSIYQLSVRVQNVAQRLDQDVASVRVAADGDIAQMDSQLQHILSRVEEVAQRLQRQQRDMLRAEQLSAVGQLAASVAHEIRNPISGVKLLVEAAQRPRNPMTLTAEDLKVIHDEIARVEQTVQGLLDFARLPSPQLQNCDLRPLVAQAVNLISSRARQQQVEVITQTPDMSVSAMVDANQFRTVLVNLMMNALDAMPGGGRLEVQVDVGHGETYVTVSDSGTGIPHEMLDKLFVPFASGKPTGTGLGLSISRRIVEEHGGSISAENRMSGGAQFTVTLPPGLSTNPELSAEFVRNGEPLDTVSPRSPEARD
jgi:signal transduction histidine kinase